MTIRCPGTKTGAVKQQGRRGDIMLNWTFNCHRESGGQYRVYAYHPTITVEIIPVYIKGNPWWEVRNGGRKLAGPYKFKRAALEYAQGCLRAMIEASLGEPKKQAQQSRQPQVSIGSMSRETALQTLGLDGRPSENEINSAHKKLISRVHPDVGGNNYLAQQINIAKDVLLGKR